MIKNEPMKTYISATITGLVLLAVFPHQATFGEQEFLAGADFSHVAWIQSAGHAYRDGGKVADPFEILKRRGVNSVRLREYTSSEEQGRQNPYDSINNLQYNIPVAKRLKEHGFHFLLDFHYSDSWADPGHQTKPKQWEGLSFEELKNAVYEHSRSSVLAYKKAGVPPDMVQIGNEITAGMIWPEGKNDSPEQWKRFAELIDAGIRGVRDASDEKSMPKIMIHIDRGGNWPVVKWFFEHLNEQKIRYDVIGLSYYPFWNGSFDDLKGCLENCVREFGKPVIVAETAFPWNEKNWKGEKLEKINGIAPGKAGQVEFTQHLGEILRSLPEHKGVGLYWWGAEFLPVEGVNMAGFEDRSFFDRQGNALPVIEAVGKLSRPPSATTGRSSH